MEVRPLRAGDAPALAALLREMQAHYGVPCPPEETILRDLAALPAGVTVLLAADPEPVGFASLGTTYPGPGLKPGLFLKDLFVSRAFRGRGAGRALLREAAALAVARGYTRLDWTADGRDARLLAFYEAIGAAALREKVFYRLDADGLARLAAEA